MIRHLTLASSLFLAACGGQDADYPQLLPMDEILTDAAPAPDPAPLRAGLDRGAAALRARAAGLRGPVIEPAIRARMTAMRARHR